jgi:hypothetical protein
MNPNQQHDDPTVLRNAISRVALGLDSLLLNGIQYGVLASISPEMVRKLGDTLILDVYNLVNAVQIYPLVDASAALRVVADLPIAIKELIETIVCLAPLEAQSADEIHRAAMRIIALRGQCVLMVEKFEDQLNVSGRFYRSRPKDAAELMDRFLANLEKALEEARQSSKRGKSPLPA